MSSLRDAENAWSECLKIIQKEISYKNFEVWFRPIKAISIENGILKLEVPTTSFCEWIEDNYLSIIKKAVTFVIDKKCKLQYSIRTTNIKERYTENKIDKENNSSENFVINSNCIINNRLKDLVINPNYNFETFIEGNCNRTVKAAAQAISCSLGQTSFNPFIVYGSVGIGKTHIAQAIGNYIKENFKNKKVAFISSHLFANQYVTSIRENFVQDFSNKFLDVDLLIVDDIQFLSGKEKTQEAFFHIFNYLHQNGKQLVMTSDTAPGEMKGLQERLLSRFKWGLTAFLKSPDIETKKKIALHKLETKKKKFAPEIINYISSLSTLSIRELEGIVNSVIFQSEINNIPINLYLVKEITSRIFSSPEVIECIKETSLDNILNSVANYYNISTEEIFSSKSKKSNIARKIIMHISKNITKNTLKIIGDFLGGKHHSTVLYSINSVEKLLLKDGSFKSDYESILKVIN